MLQAILPEKHMIDDRAHAHCGRAVNNYFVRSIVRGRIRFTGARNNCVIGYKGLNGCIYITSIFYINIYEIAVGVNECNES